MFQHNQQKQANKLLYIYIYIYICFCSQIFEKQFDIYNVHVLMI
jgi:hypothetical protein